MDVDFITKEMKDRRHTNITTFITTSKFSKVLWAVL